MKILLLMCHWIGDTFWAIQIIPELKKHFPEAELWAGVKNWSKHLLYELIDDDKIIILNNVISDRHRESFSATEYIEELKKVRDLSFDCIIDLTLNRYSAIFAFLSGAKQRIGLKEHKLSFLYTKKGDKFPQEEHLYKRPWTVLSLISSSIKIPKKLFPPKINSQKEELIATTICDNNKKIALLVPGAGWKEKEWNINNFTEYGKTFIQEQYQVIIAGSQKEEVLCKKLKDKIGEEAITFNCPLDEFVALLPNVSIAVTNDSGPAHLIASFGIKLITVFKFDNYRQYSPIGNNVEVMFENKKGELTKIR